MLSMQGSEGQVGIGQAGDYKEALWTLRQHGERGKVERAESSNVKGPLRQILQTEGGGNPRMVLSC